jgi:2-aminoethylphosphonate-pyruvate transaminase
VCSVNGGQDGRGGERLSPARDPLLFTPGPLTTSRTVKQAMLRDAGSRQADFIATVQRVRESLLRLAGVSREAGFDVILMQGSGTFGVEAVVSSAVPRDGALLVVVNGAYGERIVKMAEIAGIEAEALRYPEDVTPSADDVAAALDANPLLTHVALVHCETTTGILNPLEAIGRVVRDRGMAYIVDAMSSFGAIPIDFKAACVDFLVSSANKCVEGVPGFSFVFARREALVATEGRARSLSLDLLEQWRGLERNGQFRFTPPTHAILAFEQALRELEQEGGVEARGARYRANHAALVAGMKAMGFRPYLRPEVRSYIITSFHYPQHPAFDWDEFYGRLSDRGMIIYPGKLTDTPCFRIGTIGRIFETDVRQLLAAIGDVMAEMGCLAE